MHGLAEITRLIVPVLFFPFAQSLIMVISNFAYSQHHGAAATMDGVSVIIAEAMRKGAQLAIDRVLEHDWVVSLQPSQEFICQLRLPAALVLGLGFAVVTLLAAALCGALWMQRTRQRHLYSTLLEAKSALQCKRPPSTVCT
jgi:CHASE1-domain containing sensor protein